MKILIAEDDIVSQMVLTALIPRNHSFKLVENGADAIAKFKAALDAQAPFDIVLMDLYMPEMNGLDALSAIKAMNSNARIYVTSTCLEYETITSSMTVNGADGFIIKPVTKAKLQEILGP